MPSDYTYGIENITPEFLAMIRLPDEKGKKLHYLFVLPVIALDDNEPYAFPSGFATVCAALKASGRSVFTLNLNYKTDPGDCLRQAITTNQIDVVLTGGLGVQFWNVKMIIDAAKEIKPEVITVVGGGLITADPATAMTALENADYGVIGEGEITVNALAYALEHDRDPAELDGIICERDGTWSVHDTWDSAPNLDILPFPDLPSLEYAQLLGKSDESFLPGVIALGSNHIANLCIHRSCPYLCTFCFHTCGNKYKQMSLDCTFKLIDWIISLYSIAGLYIQSELLLADPQFALEFCRRVKPYNLRWSCTTRADIPTEEMLVAAKESGCVYLSLGIESADNRILKSMRKGITIEQVDNVLEIAHRIGLNATGTLIFGDPEETTESVQRSIEWWQQHRQWEVSLACIRAYPGSQNYKTACAKGIIKDPVQFLKNGFPLVNLSKLTDDEFAALPSLLNKLQADAAPVLEAVVASYTGYRIQVSGICPHCGEQRSFPPIPGIIYTGVQRCPACGKSVRINPSELCDRAALNRAAADLIAGKNTGIWATTHNNFYWLIQAMPCLQADNVTFINNEEPVFPENGKQIKTFAPEVITAKNIEIVIVPNVPYVFQAIKAQCAKSFPSVKQVVHITELLREKRV